MELTDVQRDWSVFAREGAVAIGAVRRVEADRLVVYVEGFGDVPVARDQIASVHDAKVVIDRPGCPRTCSARSPTPTTARTAGRGDPAGRCLRAGRAARAPGRSGDKQMTGGSALPIVGGETPVSGGQRPCPRPPTGPPASPSSTPSS